MVDSDVLSGKVPDRWVIDATPRARDIFLGYTRGGYSVTAAVAEYVDNAIEQARISGIGVKATVRVASGAFGPKITTEIQDDAGGCPKALAVRFVQPGLSGVSPSESAISRFGMGGKAAGLSIAEKVVILSRTRGEPGWRVILDREEILTKTDWQFEATGLPEGTRLEEGQTRIVLILLERPSPALFPQGYLEEFGERYAFLPKADRPTILVGNTPLPLKDPAAELLRMEEAPPGCGPRAFATTKSYPVTVEGARRLADVRFRMTVGLLPEGTAAGQYGAYVYCNGRLLVRDSKVGLGEGDLDFKEKSPSTVAVWLRAIVEVQGPSEAMPWTNRKDSLDYSSPSYRDLDTFVASSYEAFMEENLAGARRAVREQTGELPSVRELLTWNYREKIRTGALVVAKIRGVVRSTKAFEKALEQDEDLEGEEVPGPPKKKDVVTLHASIEKWKVEKIRKLIRKKLGEDTVRNADIVRISVDHYIRCVGGTPPENQEEK